MYGRLVVHSHPLVITKLKELNPNIKIACTDPQGATMYRYFKDSVLEGVIHYDYANNTEPSICKAGASPLGWQAVSYGEVLPAPTVVFRESVKLPAKCNYKIKWSRS